MPPRSGRSSRLDLPAGTGRRPDADTRAARALAPGAIGSDAWWDAVRAAGAPRWFPAGLPHDDGPPDGVPTLVLVHRDADHPHVYADLNGLTDRSELAAGTLHHVPGTDVHVGAFGVPPGYVASYAFVPTDAPLASPAARDTDTARTWWLSVLAAARPDPLHPGAHLVDSRGAARSVVDLPGRGGIQHVDPPDLPDRHERTVALVWDRPDGVAQPVWLHLPPGDDHHLGAVVVLDGRMWAERVPLAPHLDALHVRGDVPPTVAVLVDSVDPDRRAADLAGTDDYLDLLADDLLPRVVAPALADRGRRLVDDPARTAVAGQSYGGLAAFRLVAHRPDRFGASVSQSGSFWWPDLDDPAGRAMAAWLRTAPPRDVRTVVQVGAYEGDLTEANHELVALVRARGEHVDALEVPGGHDWAWWHRHLPAALVQALG
ncbi:enterochelin esterase [Cellulomonas oligotrophica]|uniref:Enterochelin esterase family protein n=1 Tax=Cellulomonas oligotrophica TaxID=931536 RepID=A0A7Y9FFI9_9CELL|nr:enterochelin esterase [Cellulomonas oligotrophica]NYD86365.1 enterochelin esterase family protein [Cellulomonas oligotrophica]